MRELWLVMGLVAGATAALVAAQHGLIGPTQAAVALLAGGAVGGAWLFSPLPNRNCGDERGRGWGLKHGGRSP